MAIPNFRHSLRPITPFLVGIGLMFFITGCQSGRQTNTHPVKVPTEHYAKSAKKDMPVEAGVKAPAGTSHEDEQNHVQAHVPSLPFRY